MIKLNQRNRRARIRNIIEVIIKAKSITNNEKYNIIILMNPPPGLGDEEIGPPPGIDIPVKKKFKKQSF